MRLYIIAQFLVLKKQEAKSQVAFEGGVVGGCSGKAKSKARVSASEKGGVCFACAVLQPSFFEKYISQAARTIEQLIDRNQLCTLLTTSDTQGPFNKWANWAMTQGR